METRYAEIHPQLRQIAKASPQLHFSRKTLWLLTTPTGYGVSVDSHWSDVRKVEEAQRTERARLEAEARVSIVAEQEATARLLWPVLAICATVAIVGVAWSKRPHRPAPPPMLLTYMASHYLPGQAASSKKKAF
mgnify:CR=1 FL=1